MRALKTVLFALALAVAALPVAAQGPIFTNPGAYGLDSISGAGSATTADTSCLLVKYVGTTAGKPTIEAAAGGDLTFKLAGSADTTTGCDNAGTCPNSGIFDLSTPHASLDTMGELVNKINTTGSNWKAVLVSCLASDLTDNTIFTLSATEAAGPAGAAYFRDAAVASATSIFSAQVALLPSDRFGHASTNYRFFASGDPRGNTTGSNKPNANPFANWQMFVTNAREKITSTGTIALFEILGVTRTYDATGQVSETVRSIWSETGAATTVEKAKDFNAGPIVAAPGELVIVRQRTGTDLTALNITGNGYMIRR